MNTLRARLAAGTVSLATLTSLPFAAQGCGSSAETDRRFASETYDEYTEPLTNALIGTPGGGGIAVDSTGARKALATLPGPEVAPAPEVAAAPTKAPPPPPGSSSGGSSSGGSSGSSSGGVFDAGSGEAGFGDDGGAPSGAFGQWHFDDCSPTSHFLADSSGNGANAQHALKSSCVKGISGLGVQFRSPKDIVQVPDEPQFTVSSKIAVAAWVHPNNVKGDQPIVLKRLNNQTSFSLGIHDGNIQMSVVLKNGKTFISQAPIAAGTWSHVAGMYDGTFVFLFLDGQQFGQVFAGGPLRDVFAPVRIGATTQTQYFNGIIDEVFVSTDDISKDTLTALACLPGTSTLAVKPATSGPVPFDTNVHYDVAVTNNDVGFCPPSSYSFNLFTNDPGITASADFPSFASSVAPGASFTFGAEVSGSSDADPGVHAIPFDVFRSEPNTFEDLPGQLTFNLAQPTGCFVTRKKELMITDVSVVDDPVRTAGSFVPGGSPFGDAGGGSSGGGFGGSSGGSSGGTPLPTGSAGTGVWSFGQLMTDLAPTPADAPTLVREVLETWLTDQTVNNLTVAARPLMQSLLLDVWPKTANGDLDLTQSPLTLSAIVTRLDLRNLSSHTAGELRFVFGVNGPAFGNFTMILEYNLPANTDQDVLAWANRVHALSSHPFPSEEYNAALEALTRSVTGRNAGPPGSPNGSNLASFRTNEIALSGGFEWELRQFALSPTTGFLAQQTVVLTPDINLNGSSTLASFINANQSFDHRRDAARRAADDRRDALRGRLGAEPVLRVVRSGHRRQRGTVPLFAQHVQRLPRPGDEHLVSDGGAAHGGVGVVPVAVLDRDGRLRPNDGAAALDQRAGPAPRRSADARVLAADDGPAAAPADDRSAGRRGRAASSG